MMEDSEILARLEHEREMRENLAADVEHLQSLDRWRWAVGIAVGILLSRTPEGLAFIAQLF